MERRSKFNISISQLVIRAKRPSTVSARRYRQAAVDFAALKYSKTQVQILEVSTELSGEAQSAPDSRLSVKIHLSIPKHFHKVTIISLNRATSRLFQLYESRDDGWHIILCSSSLRYIYIFCLNHFDTAFVNFPAHITLFLKFTAWHFHWPKSYSLWDSGVGKKNWLFRKEESYDFEIEIRQNDDILTFVAARTFYNNISGSQLGNNEDKAIVNPSTCHFWGAAPEFWHDFQPPAEFRKFRNCALRL